MATLPAPEGYQLSLPIQYQARYYTSLGQIAQLLSEDLDFRNQESGYASHQIHSFPAKFPPQLPRKFIEALTLPGEIVLDPMQGSGTTILEAGLTGRRGVGFDIDPLALLIAKVKTTELDADKALACGRNVMRKAQETVERHADELGKRLHESWEPETREFIHQWFLHQTQLELLALIQEIEKLKDASIRNFLRLVFSAIIITKSGGVSLALDLAHTRPHRAKVVFSKSGQVLFGEENIELPLNICADRANLLPQRVQRSPSFFSEHSVHSVACFGCGWKPRYVYHR